MRGSFPIGRVLGIRIRMHFTFPLLLLLLGIWTAWKANWGVEGLRAGAWLMATVAGVFACVLLHELGHSLVSMGFGYRVMDITLLPIGGMARMADLPREPWQELLISIAGPAVNFLLAVVLAVVILLVDAPWADLQPVPDLAQPWLVSNLLWVNLVLGLFNLLPAFPMDGGRILRALLGLFVPYVTATRIASLVGQGFGLLMLPAGIGIGNPLLALIGVFVFLMAGMERRQVVARSRLEGLAARSAMVAFFDTVGIEEPLDAVAARSRASFQEDFPVRDGQGRIVGLLSASHLRDAVRRVPLGTAVGAVLPAAPSVFTPDQPLADVLRAFQGNGSTAGLVVEDGRVIGIVTLDRILRAF